MSVILFSLLCVGIGYLFAKYGKLQYANGQTKGYGQGKLEGLFLGMGEAFKFLEQIGAVDLQQLDDDINAGKYDHVGNIAKNRKLADNIMDVAKQNTK